MQLLSSVHYRRNFDNALWDGTQMIFGDGSGNAFRVGAFTALDIVAHEWTHGVTHATAGLQYHRQPGALNESFSDVFGTLVRQRVLGQAVDQADWLIGPGITGPALGGVALRSMRAPGTAHNKDDQPDNMADYANLPDNSLNDWGGVHVNSGIPNRAFYLAATSLGGQAWDHVGPIWYEALTRTLQGNSQFSDCRDATVAAAAHQFGASSPEQQAVGDAWSAVGV
jgi:Zn-dependent metalloprotease